LIGSPENLQRPRFDLLSKLRKLAYDRQNYSVRMGDVNFRDKIDNNRGVITGHVYSTATEGVSISGTNVRVLFIPARDILG
jgi:hypothetical protein